MFDQAALIAAVDASSDLTARPGRTAPCTVIAARDGRPGETLVEFLAGGGIRLDDSWEVTFEQITRDDALARVLDHARLAIASVGTDVRAVLRSGPRKGFTLAFPWDEARAWHLFAIHQRPRFDVYKWHLDRDDDGALVMMYERTVSLTGLPSFASKHSPAVTRKEPARVESDRRLNIFGREPYTSLGWDFLQEQCDRWLQSPIAREFGVSYVLVSGPDDALGIDFEVTTPRMVDGERYVFPCDHLVYSVLDAAPLPDSVRLAERARLGRFWQEHPEVFRYFNVNRPGSRQIG